MKLQYIKNHLTKITVVMYGVLGTFLIFSNPRSLPVYALIAPILWLFFCMTFSVFIALNRLHGSSSRSDKRNIIYASSFSGLICTVVLLRSVNQLNGRDLLLIMVFLIIATFYTSKLRISRKAE
ncbi:MAG: hypothetical protein QG628_519 [Patescibacteria group bacterium]|jgi:hypothetical protein|nr:hypothetical protein [Patescibacteria group bacterium]